MDTETKKMRHKLIQAEIAEAKATLTKYSWARKLLLKEYAEEFPEVVLKLATKFNNDRKLTETQKKEARRDLKKLFGLPPYEEANPCRSDSIFAGSLEEKYGLPLDELVRVTAFEDLKAKWEALKNDFEMED